MVVSSGMFERARPEPTLLHVCPYRAGWCVAADGQMRPLSMHVRKDDAVALACSLAKRGARVRVHEIDGTTSELGAMARAG